LGFSALQEKRLTTTIKPRALCLTAGAGFGDELMSKIAEKLLNLKSLDLIALNPNELSRLNTFSLFFEFALALEELERTSFLNRVTVKSYSSVQLSAASLFSDLLKALPPRVAREAQSAIQNALFSLDVEDSKKGNA
jgi:hypothetical protein